ncbi:hypothetical protein LPB140_07055 [Sphingorhabdus lutea]|uniref:Uncharacterized protein n=1 Tax=Sphingorhabdus lutea TaxID=1913578 RepID=A0A1L3JBV6_9SPHN|nr:hypothetical protein [Sphingorhabdus lutea]APG62579.1 hypothetical protein LPB140_07055 [Sphingorhabdus lutea]
MEKIEQLKISIGQLELSIAALEAKSLSKNGQAELELPQHNGQVDLNILHQQIDEKEQNNHALQQALTHAIDDIDKIILQIGGKNG